MSGTQESLPDQYLERLDRWIAETRILAARTTDLETRKCADEDVRRWMDERTQYVRSGQWMRGLNSIAKALVRAMSAGAVLLFVAAIFLRPDTALGAWTVAIDVVVVLGSGVLYVIVVTIRDAVAEGRQTWRFRVRSLLTLMTIVALLLGLWTFLVRL